MSQTLRTQRAWRGISMPRGKSCRETLAQLPHNYPHRRGNFERGKKNPLLSGRGNLGGILRGNFGEGNCESKNCRETMGSQFLPRGIEMPRKALWGSGVFRTQDSVLYNSVFGADRALQGVWNYGPSKPQIINKTIRWQRSPPPTLTLQSLLFWKKSKGFSPKKHGFFSVRNP